MATIKQVAQHAGVSVGTVSNVIADLSSVAPALREKVWAAIRDLDYHPNHVARSLRVKQTRVLGLVISDITNPFFPQVVRGAEDAAFENGYVLISLNSDDRVDREKQLLNVLRARRVDGILLVVAPSTEGVSHITDMMQAGTPIVCLDRVPAGLAVDGVSVDNLKGSLMCVRHLLAMGHRDIGIITGSPTLPTARDRLAGYKLALKEAGIPINPAAVREGDFREESGYLAAKELLLEFQRPSALFVSNGMMTLGALRALEELRLRCPEDVAVAAFDDLPVADVFRPRVTCVAQPAYQIGYRGAELLIRRLQRQVRSTKPVRIRLDAELKVRESTAPRGNSV